MKHFRIPSMRSDGSLAGDHRYGSPAIMAQTVGGSMISLSGRGSGLSGGKPGFPTVQTRVPGFAQVESEADLTGGLQFAGDVC